MGFGLQKQRGEEPIAVPAQACPPAKQDVERAIRELEFLRCRKSDGAGNVISLDVSDQDAVKDETSPKVTDEGIEWLQPAMPDVEIER
jgi:hypothetical protein